MSDLLVNTLKMQGKRAKCVYGYKATMNDELNIKIDDVIMITQCSEDETWLEGTLNGVTGWFPSNYVQILEDDEADDGQETKKELESCCSKSPNPESGNDETQSKLNETLRIKYINELKKTEEGFLDEMCKFVKVALIPLQSSRDILPVTFVQHLNSSVDEVIRCHQSFYQQLKEIPDDADAKIGNLLMNMAPHFKLVYESYAKNNPKYTSMINKKKDPLSKFFEASIHKMTSPLLPATSTIVVSIYITKFLAAPFKQLEIYVKILREIHRYTEDYHIDRGDVQRCIEFYSDLSLNVQETRKKKEYELDILASKINNLDEDLFKSGEVLFVASVLIINENGDKKDRIMLLFQNNNILFLAQNNSPNEFDFDYRIQLLNQTAVKRVNKLESLNTNYGGSLLDSTLINTYMFELTGFVTQSNTSTRLLIVCSTQYDMKMLMELISGLLGKIQLKNCKTSFSNKTTTPNKTGAELSKQNSMTKGSGCTSPVTVLTQNTSMTQPARKVFSIRPHPPLIPHFQLPNDLPQMTSLDGTTTLKRFMYKKPKLSEPFGKYHGADDDLKLLNIIENCCKNRLRQSVNVNVNVHEPTGGSPGSGKMIVLSRRAADSTGETNNGLTLNGSNSNDKNLNKMVFRLTEEKTRLESNMQSVVSELCDYKKSNKELKSIITSMQKQLDNERQMRRKLETFVRKHLKNQNTPQQQQGSNVNTANLQSPHHQIQSNQDLINSILMNIEHESSI